MVSEADYRLPRSVIPSRYEIEIEPDLDAATFKGTVVVAVDVVEPVSVIVLNSIELDIEWVSIRSGQQDHVATVTYDTEQERATLTVPGTISAGPATIRFAFTGTLNDQLRGFYRSTYTAPSGETKVIATTQFESTDARRAFPCWDEPDFKAVFSVTLIVDDDLLAVSNAAEVSRESVSSSKVKVLFADTVVMSTYLVAFIVGDLVTTDTVDVDGIELRVITPPGKLHLTSFALEAGAHALRFFSEYYDVPYPGDKLDMVAIPDFSFGAMENLGCITYRETALLVDPDTATQAEMMRVAEVIGHEIAHMWFGDLVTMKWWNGIWLNEAFATFAENKFVESFRPDWGRWLFFANERSRSQRTDGLEATRSIEIPVRSPREADAMFDVLTYEKGSSILRMVERYVGEDAFRAGVSQYLKEHGFSNTDNKDLWAALEAASGEPVGDIMDTWIFQGGYPEIEVLKTENGIRLSQSPFRFIGNGEGSWQVPVLYRSDAGDGRVLVGDAPVDVATDGPVVVNAGGEGFYKVAYDEELLASIIDRMADLDAIERFSVISDTYSGVLAGDVPASDYLALMDQLPDESEIDVWAVALVGLRELGRVITADDEESFERFVGSIASRKAGELGWEPTEGESDKTKALRGLLIKTMGSLAKDRATVDMARSILETGEGTDPEVADAALSVIASVGDLSDFDRYIEMSEGAETPQLTIKYLNAAIQVPDPEVPARIIGMILDGDIRSQDSFWVLARLIGQQKTGPIAWKLTTENWDRLLEILPQMNAPRILDNITSLSDPVVAASIAEWLADHPIEGGEFLTRQKLEQLDIQVRLRQREEDRLGDALR